MDNDEAEYEARRLRERSAEMKPMAWVTFAAAALFAGKGHKDAAALADQTLTAFDHRFVRPVPRDGAD